MQREVPFDVERVSVPPLDERTYAFPALDTDARLTQVVAVDKEVPVEVPIEVVKYVDRVVNVPIEVERVIEVEKIVWNDRVEYRDKVVYQDRVGTRSTEFWLTSFNCFFVNFYACIRVQSSYVVV